MHSPALIVFLCAVVFSLAAEEVQQQDDNQNKQPGLFGNRPPKRQGFNRPPPQGFEQQLGEFGGSQGQGFERPLRRPNRHGFGKPPHGSGNRQQWELQQGKPGSSDQKPIDELTQQQDDEEVSNTQVVEDSATEWQHTLEDVQVNAEEAQQEGTDHTEDDEDKIAEE